MKTDLRVIRTQKSIKDGFLRLLEKKGYDRITVQDIAQEAFINRNTFYMHYNDKEDLLETLSRECLDDLEQSLAAGTNSELSKDFIYELIKDVLKTIDKNKDFYRIMMTDSNSSFFSERLKLTIEKHIYEYTLKANTEKIKILVEYLVTGFIGVARMYLKKEIDISLEGLSSLIFELIYENPYSLLLGEN